MSSSLFPFAVRLIGFSSEEERRFAAVFSLRQGKGYGYFRLEEDDLRNPDIYLANGNASRALALLSDLRPSDVRPALLIGRPNLELPHLCIERPVEWHKLFEALDRLVEKRADALARLEASDIVTVPERRRGDRLASGSAGHEEYNRIRARLPDNGMLVVLDRNAALGDHLNNMLARYQVPVDWAKDEATAVELCRRQTVAALIINTSTPEVDPYRLCRTVKANQGNLKIAVIFLVGKNFSYDVPRARDAGADGYLTKPLANHHLLGALKKFLPGIR